MNYRNDIDGLRAVAVLAVFIYHLGAQWLPGGFIGVDVFFVISGFLITGIIRKNIIQQSFSYSSFFVKRVRRIAPALLFMTICVVIAGYFILKPGELVPLYQSAWTQPFALQNMHFLIEGEYFNGSDRKPLLHTWSLGVEEQFYLLWPVIIFFLFKFSRGWAFAAFALILFGSFFVNLFLLSISPKASFFLFPARAWELAAGGLLAIVLDNKSTNKESRWWQEVIAFAGLLLLGAGFLGISSQLIYPGWYALIPVVGTMCLIWTSQNTYIGKILSLRPFVGIGLISYSLYLWHWPVIVFARVLEFDLKNAGTLSLVTACAFILAIFSYLLIEQPIRKKLAFKTHKHLFTSFVAVTVCLVLLTVLAIKTQGFSFRYPEPARSMLTASFNADGDGRCGFVFRVLNPEKAICHTNEVSPRSEPGVLLWGDSHAAMWLGVLNNLGQAYGRPVYLSAKNCRPIPDFAFCGKSSQEAVLQSLKENRISDVVLASHWYESADTKNPEFESELSAIVKELAGMDLNVWLVVDIPSGDKFNPIKQYEASPYSPEIGVYPYSVFKEEFLRENELFERFSTISPNVSILDPTNAICPERKQCLGGRQDNTVWYRDADHLTSTGAFTAQDTFEYIFTSSDK